MYSKLPFKNVRRSFKDYTLYFLTLTFGVCIFYIFNSIEAQKAMMSVSRSTADIMKTLTWLIGAISIFVSFILGFLIVYANNFLIRRRKKEIGIYLTLGMEKRRVAKILLVETFLIGMISLGAGLVSGLFLSQGLSVVTAKLFEADMTAYRFIFSVNAFIKTIMYFGIIYLIVMVFCTVSISKFKLIDLINAEKKNEMQKLKSIPVTIVLFIISIIFIGCAYGLVLKNGIASFNTTLIFEMILGALGTFLFFASLSGFFLRVIQTNKKIYLKGLNAFILRQINSRINTAYISISLICLMLFCTIGILSTGLGMNNALNQGFKFNTPYDVSLEVNGDGNIIEALKKYKFDIYKYTDKVVQISIYQYKKENLTKSIILKPIEKDIPKSVSRFFMGTPLYLIKLSDYNSLMNLQEKKEVSLEDKQVAVFSDYADAVPSLGKTIRSYININPAIVISGTHYKVYDKLITNRMETSAGGGVFLALIVPDSLANGSIVNQSIACFNCKGDRKVMQDKFESDMYALSDKYKNTDKFKMGMATKESVRSISAGAKAMITFICVYLGLIFLITSAALLALQQMTEASDNRYRYNIIRKVGADDRMIRSALFKQIAIYFLLPLCVACIHSIVGIKVANDAIISVGGVNVIGNIIITAILIVAVYGAYFLATYFSSRSLILNSRM